MVGISFFRIVLHERLRLEQSGIGSVGLVVQLLHSARITKESSSNPITHLQNIYFLNKTYPSRFGLLNL